MPSLYPEPNCNYWYFCATGVDGGTAFASTLSQHEENVEKYRENWIAADNAANEETTATSETSESSTDLVVVPTN